MSVYREDCPCTRDCPRHGKCDECIANHAILKIPNGCERAAAAAAAAAASEAAEGEKA